jgi:predicted DNA-binding transcriptional regulator YafY
LVLGLRFTVELADADLGRAATEVVAKLRAVLPKDLRTVVDEVALLAGPASERAPETIELSEVRRAIREQHKARMTYVDERCARSERVVWPIGLGFFQRARVLVTWCEARADFRSFRTDRIEHWQTLSAHLPKSRSALLRQWRERERIPAQI